LFIHHWKAQEAEKHTSHPARELHAFLPISGRLKAPVPCPRVFSLSVTQNCTRRERDTKSKCRDRKQQEDLND
jgi:hypothetical protein